MLVVDDEPTVLHLLQTLLPRIGFDVLPAGRGREALDAYRRHRDAVAVVLLDVNMPDMSGPEVLAALRQIAPDVRCCFMTGLPGEPLPSGVPVVYKPFQLDEIASALRSALERPP